MPYRFELSEDPEAGLRRISAEQASRIVKRLRADSDGRTVHESRKALKRLKALFKLVRPGLAPNDYKREYAVVRDVGRMLSGSRDFEVLPATLAHLVAHNDEIDEATVRSIAAAIDNACAEVADNDGRAAMLDSAASQIEAARVRFRKLKLDHRGFETLAAGAADGMRLLRRDHDLATASGEDEDYHDWRKSAQLHWRQLRLLSPAWPTLMAARIEVTKSLAQALGDDHDLTVLAEFVAGMPASRLRAARRKAVVAAIKQRQLLLRAEARAYASPLVVTKPGLFAKQLASSHAARQCLSEIVSPPHDPFLISKTE